MNPWRGGIRITIDDFGTQYSSLSYLRNLPVNTIKIDQCFVREIEQGREDSTIIRAIVAIAAGLGLHGGRGRRKPRSRRISEGGRCPGNGGSSSDGRWFARNSPACSARIWFSPIEPGVFGRRALKTQQDPPAGGIPVTSRRMLPGGRTFGNGVWEGSSRWLARSAKVAPAVDLESAEAMMGVSGVRQIRPRRGCDRIARSVLGAGRVSHRSHPLDVRPGPVGGPGSGHPAEEGKWNRLMRSSSVQGWWAACARVPRRKGLDTLVLETSPDPGSETSSRNSEVIHAGIYAPRPASGDSCVAGNRMMYAYCRERGVDHRACGKLIVATAEEQEADLRRLLGPGMGEMA